MTRTAEQLQSAVEQELRWEPSIHAAQIGVSVRNGIVELDGHVASFYEKWGAERAAQRVSNAAVIASEIIVDIPMGDTRSDEDIAVAAHNQMEWNSLVPDTVHVKVSNGWITLSGTTEWQYQREAAQRIFGTLLGVKGMTSEIVLKPGASASDVTVKIEQALLRDAHMDADRIQVEANGSTITLRGRVHSWIQRENAEQIAFGAPGVSTVENMLEIRP